jgi:hypothetical protein
MHKRASAHSCEEPLPQMRKVPDQTPVLMLLQP